MSRGNPVTQAYNQGRAAGQREVRQRVLDFLEREYMSPMVKRKTPHAEKILRMARELSEAMRNDT